MNNRLILFFLFTALASYLAYLLHSLAVARFLKEAIRFLGKFGAS